MGVKGSEAHWIISCICLPQRYSHLSDILLWIWIETGALLFQAQIKYEASVLLLLQLSHVGYTPGWMSCSVNNTKPISNIYRATMPLSGDCCVIWCDTTKTLDCFKNENSLFVEKGGKFVKKLWCCVDRGLY